MIELVPLFLGVFLAQASPGPNSVAVAQVSMSEGRRAGILCAAGVATGVFVWAMLFTFGLGALIAAYPALLTAMRLIGGAYLIWLGVRTLRRNRTAASATPATRPRAPYLTGLFIVLTNPKAMAMWVAVSAYLASLSLPLAGVIAVGATVALSALLIYGAQGLLFSTDRIRAAHDRFRSRINAGLALVFASLGAALLYQGIRELRA